jgi:hypothetical protein
MRPPFPCQRGAATNEYEGLRELVREASLPFSRKLCINAPYCTDDADEGLCRGLTNEIQNAPPAFDRLEVRSMVSWIWEYTRACLRKEGAYGEDQRGDHRRVECAITLLDDTDRCQGHSLRFEVAVDIEFHITDRRLSIRGGNMRAPRHPHSGAFSHYRHHRPRSYPRSSCPIPYTVQSRVPPSVNSARTATYVLC